MSKKKGEPQGQPASSDKETVALEFDDGREQIKDGGDFAALAEEQKARFLARFKRDFTSRDPLFFDPDSDEPILIHREKLSPELLAAFEQASIQGAMLYAQAKVGFFLSPMNYIVATDEDQELWEGALREFAYLKGVLK
jgi:hypothetical protein